jgi:uncharacterized protein (TIGR02246 family)
MRIRLVIALAGSAISLALPTFAQETNTPDPQTTQKILAIAKAYDEAVNTHDAAALAALYTEDAVFVTDGGPVHGRQAIEKWYANVFQGWQPKNHTGTFDGNAAHLIDTPGNAVWATGNWSETGQGQGGSPMQIRGYWSAIDVREGEGWKIRVMAYNLSPAPAVPTATSSSQ